MDFIRVTVLAILYKSMSYVKFDKVELATIFKIKYL
jgi:hypothetical protein